MKNSIAAVILATGLIAACGTKQNNLVNISGKVTNPMGDIVQIGNQDTKTTFNIDEQGNFQGTMTVEKAARFDFAQGMETTAMYIQPGENINISIDTKLFDETIKYTGSPGSSFLAEKYIYTENLDLRGEIYYKNTEAEYQATLEKYKSYLLDKLKPVIDTAFVHQESKTLENEILNLLEGKQKIAEYGEDASEYLWKAKNLEEEYNFFAYLDTSSLEAFEQYAAAYKNKAIQALEKVENDSFVVDHKNKIDSRIAFFSKRAVLMSKAPADGDPAIDFSYQDLNGEKISLSSLKGSLVYVDVWATWCNPCKAEIPFLQKLEEDYADKNIRFVSVSIDKNKEKWEQMVTNDSLGGIQLWAGSPSQITDDYAIFGIPRFMLIDEQGNLISTNANRPSSDDIRELIDGYLM